MPTYSLFLPPTPNRAVSFKLMAENHEETRKKEYKLDFKFFTRCFHLGRILFQGCLSVVSLMFIFLTALVLLEQYVVYNVGILPSQFYKVLVAKQMDKFWQQTLLAFGIIFAVAIVKSLRQYAASLLYLLWRQIICITIHRAYFSNDNYYKLNMIHDHGIDNPDQRITQDVDKMCSGFSKIVPTLIVTPFVICYYTYQAYNITGYLGPVGAFLIFFVSTVINKLLMNPIISLVVKQEEKEGNFRFKHMQIRTYSESLGFCGTSNTEYVKANAELNALLKVQNNIVNWQCGLNVAINVFDYVGAIASYLFLAIPIATGKYDDLQPADLGALISQNAFICIYLINSFTTLVDTAVQATDIAGNTHRVAEIIEQLSKYQRDLSNDDYQVIPCGVDSQRLFENPAENAEAKIGFYVNHIDVCVPESPTILIKALTIQFVRGKNVLIMGQSSSGKTSLMRVLKGLRPPYSGNIILRTPLGPHGVFFMPSVPFLTTGSLAQQIIYPFHEDDDLLAAESKININELLKLAGLTSLVEKCGGLHIIQTWNWYDKLSPGEMQRLNFVRLFYHQPLIAVMDESTSAVSMDVEHLLYQECINRNITLISIGHRNSLKRYHQVLLQLDGQGNWTLNDIIDGERESTLIGV